MNSNLTSNLSQRDSIYSRIERGLGDAVEAFPQFWRQAQITSGLILFFYVTTHLINHAVGIYSLALMNSFLKVFVLFWHFPLMQFALYGALLLHLIGSVRSMILRKTLVLPMWQWAQIVSGFLIPLMVFEHIVRSRAVPVAFDLPHVNYAMMLANVWPEEFIEYVLMILLVWIHGCVGIHMWFRHKTDYRKYRIHLLIAAVGLPLLAIFGIIGGGVERSMNPPAPVVSTVDAPPADSAEGLEGAPRRPDPALRQEMNAFATRFDMINYGILTLIILMIASSHIVRIVRKRQGAEVSYGNGVIAHSRPGMSLLEISRLSRIPHASVCGGRGRCSTCRVLVAAGGEHLDPRSPEEDKVLQRIKAPDNVRLACQIRPNKNLSVTRIVPPESDALGKNMSLAKHQGVEQTVTILFSDLRGFTTLSEPMLPFDVVFLLNQYFQQMTFCIEEAGGTVDKFIGDGIMATFGTDSQSDTGAKQGIDAAIAMSVQLERFNKDRGDELSEPLRMGIGVHTGTVIYGAMGAGKSLALTSIGDAVNAASRLESATKEHDCQIIVSEECWRHSGYIGEQIQFTPIKIKGRSDISVAQFPSHENLSKAIKA